VRILWVSWLALFFAAGVSAMPLAEYRERVRRSVAALEELTAIEETSELMKRAPATFRFVRSTLPATDTVKTGTSSVEVNNAWLNEALKDYEKALASDPHHAAYVLAETTERLQALSDRLQELDKPSGSVSESKDEDRARIASILRRDQYNQMQAEPSALSRLWKQFLEWLARLVPQTGPLPRGEPAAVSRFAEIFVVVLAMAAISFVVWKLGPRFLRRAAPRKRPKREARVVLGERLGPDRTAKDLLAEADDLARAGNQRGAIRKGYIALLCELSDRKVLRLAQSRTNRDYLRAVQDRRVLHDFMRGLTESFEKHWYGLTPATENDWSAFRATYQKALAE
jgi:hypothetical protein